MNEVPTEDFFPKMVRLRQTFEQVCVETLEPEIIVQLSRLELAKKIKPGEKIAITAGSRGIVNIGTILKTVVQYLQSVGGVPFLVPAMGSHGGATAAGQLEVLATYGITEATMGCAICATMETEVLFEVGSVGEIHFDRTAARADHVLVVGRIKPHTTFSGPIESGLVKMLLIGLGNQAGAEIFHKAIKKTDFITIIDAVTPRLLQAGKIIGGLAILENGYEETAQLKGLLPSQFRTVEPTLLTQANRWLPRLPFKEVEVLIVDEMGKNISGTGMDTNVIGRKYNDRQATGSETPRIKRIVARGLSEATQGNGLGIGIADFCTRQLVRQLDQNKTQKNGETSGHLGAAKIPPVFESDREAIQAAIFSLSSPPQQKDLLRLVWIKNTLDLVEFECSAGMLSLLDKEAKVEVLGAAEPMRFNSAGRLLTRERQK